jgi:hypothetical protein
VGRDALDAKGYAVKGSLRRDAIHVLVAWPASGALIDADPDPAYAEVLAKDYRCDRRCE